MLIFCDSFDLYNTLTQKYDVVSGTSGGPTISATNPRTGTQSMKTTANQTAQKNIPLSQTIINGVAVDVTAGSTEFTVCGLLDGNISQVAITCDSSGHIRAYRGPAEAILLGVSVSAMSFGTYHYIESRVKIDPSVGTIDVHVDGVSVLSLSGQNTRVSGLSQISAVYWNGGSSGTTIYWDDLYICDTSGSFNNGFLGPTSILAFLPTGNGTLDQWTIGGSAPAATNWQSVKDNPPDDGVTFVVDGTIGDIDRYTFPSIASSYPTIVVGTISAVVINLRAELDTPGSRSIRGAVLSGGTSGTSPSDLVLTSSWSDYQGILEVDPNTSSPWTVAAVNAAEFGQKVTA